jgi:hypothetical protein
MNFNINELLGVNNITDFSFGLSVGAGAIVVLLLLFFLFRLYLFFLFKRYPRKVKELELSGEKGNLILTARSISDLVKALAPNSHSLQIKKVALFELKNSYSIKIQADYNIGGDNLPDIKEETEDLILDTLKSKYGIENIKFVTIRLEKAIVPKNSIH